MDKQTIIDELRRVAAKLGTTTVTRRNFTEHGQISYSTVRYYFRSWRQALESAGLATNPLAPPPEWRQQKLSDEELLQEIVRLTKELGRKPTIDAMNARGRFSVTPYRKRWGSLENACQAAYAKYGFPDAKEFGETTSQEHAPSESQLAVSRVVVPKTHIPKEAPRRKKVQFGEPIDFRGLRFAPINEQGVVYVFGMISRELGFLIESIRTDYPDCEGKRCVDPKKQRWEHVLIEFEYQSSNFREHGHSAEDCDLIVCWIHDWEECPIEVLELRSQISYLPTR
jgi:hypothetical protein